MDNDGGLSSNNLFKTFMHSNTNNNPNLPQRIVEQNIMEDVREQTMNIRSRDNQSHNVEFNIGNSSSSLTKLQIDQPNDQFDRKYERNDNNIFNGLFGNVNNRSNANKNNGNPNTNGNNLLMTQSAQYGVNEILQTIKVIYIDTLKDMKQQLIKQKQQLSDKNTVHLISNDYRIPQVFNQISRDLDFIYEKLAQLNIEAIKQQLRRNFQNNIKAKNLVSRMGSASFRKKTPFELQKKNSKFFLKKSISKDTQKVNQKDKDKDKDDIRITNMQPLKTFEDFDNETIYKYFDLKTFKKIHRFSQLLNQTKLQKVRLFLNSINMQRSIQKHFISEREKDKKELQNKNKIEQDKYQKAQGMLRTKKQYYIRNSQDEKKQQVIGNYWVKQQKSRHIFDFLPQKISILMEMYQSHIKKFGDYANIRNLKKNIFGNIDFIFYLPTMMKVTLLDVDSLNKGNHFAEVSIKVQIKVSLPGFINSPKFYENLIKQKFQIGLHNQDLAGQSCLLLNFRDEKKQSQSKLKFYQNALKYFQTTHNWGAYNFQQNVFRQNILNFDGFIIVAEFNKVAVKVQSHDFFSPTELLDLRGTIQIKPIQVSLRQMQSLILLEDHELLQFFYQANPELSFKFSLISLYRQGIQLTPQISMNHINTTQNIVQDGYSSAPNLMLIQFSSSSHSRYELERKHPPLNEINRKSFRCCIKFSKTWIKKKTDRQKQNKYMEELYQKVTLPRDFKTAWPQTQQLINFKNRLQQLQKKIIQQTQKQQNEQFQQQDQQRIKNMTQSKKHIQNTYQSLQRQLTKLMNLLSSINHEYKQIITNRKLSEVASSPTINIERIKYQICLVKSMQLALLSIIQTDQDNSFYVSLENLRKVEFNLLEVIKMENRWRQKICRKLSQTKQQKSRNKKFIKNIKKQQKQIQNFVTEYFNTKKNFNQNQYEFDHWFSHSKARFHFPFFRYPITSLLLIFVSVVFLGFVNLVIFFQTQSIDNRIGNLATLLIAYVGMIAVMQSQVNSNTITCTQIIVYSTMISSVTCLFYSLYLNFNRESTIQNQATYRTRPEDTGAFYISIFSTLLSLIYPIAMIIYFQCYAVKKYRSIEKPLFKAHQKLYIYMPGTQQTHTYINQKKQFKKVQLLQNQSLPYMLTQRLIGCLEKALEQSKYKQINAKFIQFINKQTQQENQIKMRISNTLRVRHQQSSQSLT